MKYIETRTVLEEFAQQDTVDIASLEINVISCRDVMFRKRQFESSRSTQ